MGQGSQEVYISYPLRSNVPSLAAAARIALTSACAVGSQDVVTRSTPVATITPSLVAITAPKGPPPFSTFSFESSIAFRISSSLVMAIKNIVSFILFTSFQK